jgi:hypothetical protein
MSTLPASGQNRTLHSWMTGRRLVGKTLEVHVAQVSHFGQTLTRGRGYDGCKSHYENTLPSPIRVSLRRMQWPGYLRGRFDSRNGNSARDQHQADRFGVPILREALRWSARFRCCAPHGAVRMELGDCRKPEQNLHHIRFSAGRIAPRSAASVHFRCHRCAYAQATTAPPRRVPQRHELGTAVHR